MVSEEMSLGVLFHEEFSCRFENSSEALPASSAVASEGFPTFVSEAKSVPEYANRLAGTEDSTSRETTSKGSSVDLSSEIAEVLNGSSETSRCPGTERSSTNAATAAAGNAAHHQRTVLLRETAESSRDVLSTEALASVALTGSMPAEAPTSSAASPASIPSQSPSGSGSEKSA